MLVAPPVLSLRFHSPFENFLSSQTRERADDTPFDFEKQVYKFDEGTADEVTAYVSFGGLLMALTGSYRHVSGVTVGEYIYLLVRK